MKFSMFSMFSLTLLSCGLTSPHDVLKRTDGIEDADERDLMERLLASMIAGDDKALGEILDEMEKEVAA